VIVILDALDEHEDEQPVSSFSSVLEEFASQFPKVNFFLASRPEPQLLEDFRLPPLERAMDVFALHKVGPNRIGSDIQLFFRHNSLGLAGRRGGLADRRPKSAWTSSVRGRLDCSSMQWQ